MVYLNDKKFACESCIKGHRSSSCRHADRPLFEIKKKGRPVSQCEKCRELRQSKKLHSKCTCVHKPEAKEATQPLVASSTSKTRRFIPIVPALPNGLKDVLSQSSSHPQTVDALLNPCNCKSLLKCKCTAQGGSPPQQHRVITHDLAALASAAAAMQSIPSSSSRINNAPSSEKRPERRGRPMKLPYRKDQSDNLLHLPPLAFTPSQSSSRSPPSMPNFGTMSPIKQMISPGCTCGENCVCSGCVEHKGTTTDRARNKCGDGCGDCIDPSLQFSLPTGPMAAGSCCSGNNNNNESFLDRFFARAAALPPPPEHRRMPFQLNPIDTTVYANKAAPPVNLPKLCCGGECSCEDSCTVPCRCHTEEGRAAVSSTSST